MCLIQQKHGDEQVGLLLDELEHCGPKALDTFVEALNETGQEHAAQILTEARDNQPDGNYVLL